ncbi:hypothetical protein GWK47_039556 [Chionoecetes opilio]|uniref:Uncharacterized protein n=1 Tax=Chionoecetes opilio TaxID=41210 RepID=A0A8J5CY15_CHIOP|nr:hypothetical protein GWK47_039556 [Chionoecetes opilio]
MRLTVLTCWGVMAALVVAVQGKAFAPPTFDIAAAYENYHNLWMSEARRNSVAPMSVNHQIARQWPRMRSAIRKAATPAPVAEKPPQAALAAVSETKKAAADQTTQEPAVATEQQTENQMPTEQPTPEPTTEMATTEMPMVTEAPQQPTTAGTSAPNKKASPQQQTSQQATALTPRRRRPTQRPTQMQTAFDNFFDIWNYERIRNSKPPVATPIPPLSRPFPNLRQTKQRKPMARPVDPPAQATAKTPASKAPVDTLTQKAPAAAVATITPDASNIMSLIDNWGGQGSGSPLVIILQQPGAAAPVMG